MKNIIYLLFFAFAGLMLFSCVEDEPFPAPPLLSNLNQDPSIPSENDAVTISVDAASITDITYVKLFYKIDDSQFVEVNMTKAGSTNTYSATIPGQDIGTTVRYYVESENVIGKKAYMPATAPAEPAIYKIGGVVLMHYWHFNNMPGGAVTEISADFSAVGAGLITYPGTGEGYLDERTYRAADPVSNLNLRMGQLLDAGAVLRVRNPSATRELVIAAPSTGFEKLVVTFAISRSSIAAPAQEFYYSANGGTSWVKFGDAFSAQDIPIWELKVIDLSSVTEINNNPDLRFKFVYIGPEAENTSGNNRYDNFTIDGNVL
jgi:hypothetical protein